MSVATVVELTLLVVLLCILLPFAYPKLMKSDTGPLQHKQEDEDSDRMRLYRESGVMLESDEEVREFLAFQQERYKRRP